MNVALILSMLAVPASPAVPILSEPDTRSASEAFAQGVDAFASGEFEVASTYFADANAILSHPSTIINLALSLEKLGDVSGAWWVLSDGAIFDVDADTKALETARSTLESRLFVVEFETREDAVVCVDDVALPAVLPGRYRIAMRPGRHRVRIDGLEVGIEGEAGSTRAFGFRHAEDLMVPSQRVSTTWMAGTAGGLALLGGGLAVGAHVNRDRDALVGALIVGSAVSTAAASGLAIALAVRASRSPEAIRRAERERRRTFDLETPSCTPFQDPRDDGRPSGLPLEGVGPEVPRRATGS